MKNRSISFFLGFLTRLIRLTNLGHGSTWPGHIALKLNSKFIEETVANHHIIPIIIAGTNGKTTTARMLMTILEENDIKVFQNESGANLLNGIASSLILHSTILLDKKERYAILEADENTVPQLLERLRPKYLILTNLFRDQLDRYGEVRTIASRWKGSLKKADKSLIIIANGDDPQIVGICEGLLQKTIYFGLKDGNKTKTEHASDSIYCPRCDTKLAYTSVQFSHLGDWSCPSCKFKRPHIFTQAISLPLLGSYNAYNGLAAYLTAQSLGIDQKRIISGLSHTTPAFGRQEEFEKDGKKIKIFLAKNPTGMNESLRTIKELGGKYLLFVLNDQIPDGTDISWIWDVDFETLINNDSHAFASGDRAYDMGLRLKYAKKWQMANGKWQIDPNLENIMKSAIKQTPERETLYILPTYSAMLNVRKLITGRKIL